LLAALAPAEGTDSADLHANLRNTPWFEVTAEEDLDMMGKNAKALYTSLSADGYDATLLDYSLKTHEYSSIYDTLPRLLRFFSSHSLAARPAVVSWTRPVGQDNPALHQKYDGAWWLRDVTPAVESMALPHRALGPGTVTDTMVDEGGPTGRTAAELFQTVPPSAPAVVATDTLRVTSVGAVSASVRLADAGLLHRPRLVFPSQASRALSLRLVGETRRMQRIVDGAAAGVVTAQGGAVTVLLPAGAHVVVLTPLVVHPTTPARGSLPMTGAPWALALAGAALLAMLAAARRRSRQ
jgi:hypothetical protein